MIQYSSQCRHVDITENMEFLTSGHVVRAKYYGNLSINASTIDIYAESHGRRSKPRTSPRFPKYSLLSLCLVMELSGCPIAIALACLVTLAAQTMQYNLLLSREGRTQLYDRFLLPPLGPLLNYRCNPHRSRVQQAHDAGAIANVTLSNALDFSSEMDFHINDVVYERVT